MKHIYLLLFLLFFNYTLNAQLKSAELYVLKPVANLKKNPNQHDRYPLELITFLNKKGNVKKKESASLIDLKKLCDANAPCHCNLQEQQADIPTLLQLTQQYNLREIKQLDPTDKQQLLKNFFTNHLFENYTIHRRIFLALAYTGAFDEYVFNRIAKIALEASDLPFAQFIFNKGISPNKESIFHKEHSISLPLFFLSKTPQALELCIKHQANLSQTNINGNNFLHHIAAKNSYGSPTVKSKKLELLKCYLSLNQNKETINVQNEDGNTPLHIVCAQELDDNIVTLFLNHSACLTTENKKGETPISLLQKRKRNASELSFRPNTLIEKLANTEFLKIDSILTQCLEHSKKKNSEQK